MNRYVLVLILILAVANVTFADTLLVGNKSRNTLSLVNLQTGKVAKVLPTGVGPHEVDVSHDGRTALIANYGGASGPGKTLTVVDVMRGAVVSTIDLGGHIAPHGVAWLPDNRRVVVTTEGSGEIVIVDVPTGKVERAIPTNQKVSHMVAVARDGGAAYVANIGSGSVSRLALDGSAAGDQKATGEGAEGIALTADDKEVWVANRAENTLTVLATKSLAVLGTLKTGEFPIRVEMTSDGRHALVSNARSSELGVYDVGTRKEIKRVKLPVSGGKGASMLGEFGDSSVPVGIQSHPNKALAYIAHANGDVVTEISTESWSIVRKLDAGPEPDGMGYSALDVVSD